MNINPVLQLKLTPIPAVIESMRERYKGKRAQKPGPPGGYGIFLANETCLGLMPSGLPLADDILAAAIRETLQL